MKTWNFYDKSSWGLGPWLSEPDKAQWTDETTGLVCLAKRAVVFEGNTEKLRKFPGMGHWCGYVGIPEGHPFYGVHYRSIDEALEVHGGITFSNFCEEGDGEDRICHIPEPGQPDKIWWFGFDCAHYQDLSPGRVAIMNTHGIYNKALHRDTTYRDLEYVKSECRNLAKQLAEKATKT